MPEAIEYIQPDSKYRSVSSTFSPNSNDRIPRAKRFEKAWDYYNGKQKEFLQRLEGEPNDNMVINLVKMALERTSSFLFPMMPKFSEGNTTDESPNELFVKNTFLYNGGLALFQKMVMLGFLSGHVYVRIHVPKNNQYPKLSIMNPKQIQTYWRAGDVDDILWHELYWSVSVNGQSYEYITDFIKNDNGTWTITEYSNRDSSTFREVKRVEWGQQLSPIIQWQHLPNPMEFYGIDEVGNLHLQDSVNLRASEMARINRYHASPRTIAYGVEEDEIFPTAVNEMLAIPNSEARVENLEMQGDLSASVNLTQFLYDAFLMENRVVVLRGDIKDFQRVTNNGVRTVFMDSLAKREVLLNQYYQGIKDIVARIGMVSGRGVFDNVAVIPVSPLPMDEMERARIQELKIGMGTLSRQEAIIEDGRDPSETIGLLQYESDTMTSNQQNNTQGLNNS